MISAQSTVRLDHEGAIVTLTLDRAETLNAISMQLVEDLNAALDAASELRPRCLILTGAGRGFCAGGDISAHVTRPPDVPPYDLGDVLKHHFNPLLLRLLHWPSPTVFAINGAAAGAGLPLALAGDVVIAARSAKFECGFARIGLMPDLGATWLLPRLIGRARAHAMMMLDQRVTAEQAEAWGMIHSCVDDAALAGTAMSVAQKLAAAAPAGIVATRLTTLDAYGSSLSHALDAEAEAQRSLGFSADFQEGVAAFFARRAPEFKGQ